ncbi:MAG: hypothetical protein L6R40_006102 [Gallowayella cf. fulva]|nr:MAG: hypothetical protein L6R40_006102 [Xanthomendoza cf. fulva]
MASTGTLTRQKPSSNAVTNQRNPTPATPQSANAQTSQPAAATPSPGRWRHPHFDEITQRQKASTFDETNLRRIIWNIGFVIVLYTLRNFLQSNPGTLSLLLSSPSQSYLRAFLFYTTLLPIYNIVVDLWPLYKGHDNISDISLTPSQRALLGLDPNATPPPTVGAQYITPPRYARSPTPRNDSGTSNRSRHSSAGKTPFSHQDQGSQSSLFGSSENPFSPSASPLWQKSMLGNGRDTRRRSSLGTPSPLGPGKDSGSLWMPHTPSPTAGRGQATRVGLNNRWLYERGRTSSGRSVA